MTKLRLKERVEISWIFRKGVLQKGTGRCKVSNAASFLSGFKDKLGYQNGKQKNILEHSFMGTIQIPWKWH